MSIDLTNRNFDELEKLPPPSNASLYDLFKGIDNVVIKQGGVYQEQALTDEIVLKISAPALIQQFNAMLEIDEVNTGFYCCCSGDYAIELHTATTLKTTIGFHHGVSIRYKYWNSDALLTKSDALLTFLAEQGLTKPLEDKQSDIQEREAQRVAERAWLHAAPNCFAKYWEAINTRETPYLPMLMADLDDEIPNKQEQVIALLQLFGNTKNFWTAYPSYEAVPQTILHHTGIQTIIEAYNNSDKNYKTRRGLGRFLCTFDSKKQWKKYLKYVSDELINELEKCFEVINEPHGLYELNKMRKRKAMR